MKTTIIIILSTLILGAKEYDQVQLKVGGLGCPFCAYGLEKKFKEVPGIKGMEIDLESGSVNFKSPASFNITIEAIQDIVQRAGYEVQSIEVNKASGEKLEYENPLAIEG